jgi:hypothetical protein
VRNRAAVHILDINDEYRLQVFTLDKSKSLYGLRSGNGPRRLSRETAWS